MNKRWPLNHNGVGVDDMNYVCPACHANIDVTINGFTCKKCGSHGDHRGNLIVQAPAIIETHWGETQVPETIEVPKRKGRPKKESC